MREIKAIIRTERLDVVLNALQTHPQLPGVTVSRIRGFGRVVGRSRDSDQAPIQYGTAVMTKLECVVNDDSVDSVIDIIQATAQTGQAGDGKIFIYDVREMVKIRTGRRSPTIE